MHQHVVHHGNRSAIPLPLYEHASFEDLNAIVPAGDPLMQSRVEFSARGERNPGFSPMQLDHRGIRRELILCEPVFRCEVLSAPAPIGADPQTGQSMHVK